MTDFLGREDCIQSLRKDLVDLQGAILDVFSRTGPVRVSSWKFPDKLSCNLDMVALLDQYHFIEGEDKFNQYSHMVLLELVIDRLLLLLQSFNVFVANPANSFKRNQTQEKGYVPLGLVVRNYWSNLVTYQVSSKKQTLCDDLLSSLEPSQNLRSDHCSSAKSSTSSLSSLPQNHSVHSSIKYTPKVDTQNVGSQTFESCLVPCDACYQTQSVLRKTGGALIELFQSEGLPSSLQPLSVAVQDTVALGQLTATDVTQWGAEELRDMRRLTKHLQDVRGTVEPLKAKIVTVETEKDGLKSDVKRLQKELKEKVENYQAINVQLEFSLRKAQRSAKETQQRQQEGQQKCQREIMSMEERNSSLMEKVAVQQDTIKAFETENDSLQEKIRQLQEEKESCSHQLQKEMEQFQGDISELQLCLQKEKAKYHSACRQQESMQAKQKNLVERVDGLDEECEELQRQVAESEEKQIELHGQIQQMSEDSEQLQAKLNQQQDLCVKLEKDKEKLRTKISDLTNTVAELKQHIKACTERERLLVAFPDLNPLPQAHPQSTGNVTLDMEQQFKANCIRIHVLEQENSTLYCSLLKLKERAQSSDEPQKIWNDWQRIEEYPTSDVQGTLLPRGSAERLQQYSNDRKEAEGESGLKSAASEDRMSASASSLSSVQLHFQTLQLHSSSVKTRKIRVLKQRRM
ncbi:coiled-coil domain-containing protein 157 [Eucyclogobius newberryi]|uniref:coiled-coil domain-containing protein 157 n=1 Tax=Eucyclogobius newberryi TaxID=166745 RepID=UPI003B593CA0